MAGVDVIVAQSAEAGGYRSVWRPDARADVGTFALLPDASTPDFWTRAILDSSSEQERDHARVHAADASRRSSRRRRFFARSIPLQCSCRSRVMSIAVFLSYPKPCFGNQKVFVDLVYEHLRERGFDPRTLGVTDYDMDAPLTAIRRLMRESNGLLTIAFRRTYVEKGTARLRTDIETLKEEPIDGRWLTTPWAHIEPAMAYQLGLPVLILREKDVLADGILEHGVVGLYMPEFDLGKPPEAYFAAAEWKGVIGKWEGYVRAVLERKGRPPRLY
jgi:hypothetical protein